MLPFHDSISSNPGNQDAYRDLIHNLSQFFLEESLTERLNIEQMFILVDGVLPIEACLYYQVLPLFLDGSRLHLGMVSPEDTTASDYVRRIVSYLNYSLITRRISSQALQAALSAYLKYSDSQSSSAHKRHSAKSKASSQVPNDTHPSSNPTHNLETNSQETLVLDATEQLSPSEVLAQSQENDAVNGEGDTLSKNPNPLLPADELTCIDPEETEIISLGQTQPSSFDPQETLDTALPVEALLQESEALASGANITHATAEEVAVDQTANPTANPTAASASPSNSLEDGASPLSVQINTHHLDQSIDHLGTLAPRALLRELLARAMQGGIGRLYFERKSEYGRILWSQSGVLQAAADDIPPHKFQALINEFKRLTRLPLLPLQKTKQVELERFYNQSRVLLRFRFIPGKYGEQVTLQVLRGAALNFYQQQQVTRIGQDALTTAKRLQIKITELRSRIEAYPSLSASEQASLPELKQMLQTIEQQVNSLNQSVLDYSQQEDGNMLKSDQP